MKVLFASNYIYDNRFPEYSKECTGLGYMITDILREVSKHEETYLYTHSLTKGINSDYNVLKHRFKDILLSLRINDIRSGIKIVKRSNVDSWKKRRYLYCFLDKGCFIRQLKKIKPDIVHVHGGSLEVKPYIDACVELKIPFLITLHGLNHNVDKVLLCEKEYEKYLIEFCSNSCIPISVVSSGIRKEISKTFNIATNSIRVVLNGTKLPKIMHGEFKEGHDKYIIMCVGSICTNKNQYLLLKALEELPAEYKNKICVKFCGKYMNGPHIDEEIEDRNLKKNAEYIGFVERENMNDLWKEANLNVVLSKSEGFGLSIIEGFAYGIPTLTVADLSAVEDLYSPEAMCLIDERTEKAVADGIVKCIERTWNHESIKKWSKNFSLGTICKEYISFYRDILEDR